MLDSKPIIGSLILLTSTVLGGDSPDGHRGPAVDPAGTGPARFAKTLYDAYDPERAMKLARFADGFYREPGNDGFEATLDEILKVLRAAGFEGDGFELEIIETPLARPAWTPKKGLLELMEADGTRTRLLGFDSPEGRHRTMLPTRSPSADVEGKVVFDVDDAGPGDILVTEDSPSRVARKAMQKKVAAVLGGTKLPDYNRDPTGKERHLDAIRYGRVWGSGTLPVGHISPRVYARLKALSKERGEIRVRFLAEVALDERPLRTVVATILGSKKPDEVIPIACHVQEPGAVDNASGLAGLAEGARILAESVRSGAIPRPARSVALIWGNEMQESRIFLDHTKRKVVAAFSADMIGASREKTGALPLLERDPDPGALRPLPPDEHTAWGMRKVTRNQIKPNGVSVIARCALRDVAGVCGGWETAEHPWEGGSDHDIFIAKGVPAVLLWHFTDFAYHTNLDRIEHIDPESMRRMSVVLLAATLAIADPREADLERYRKSLSLDREVRVAAARKADSAELVKEWEKWYEGANRWLEGIVVR